MSAVAAALGRRAGALGASRGALTIARDYGMLIVLAALVVLFSATTDAFLTTSNLRNLAEQSGEPALLACGMTVVIIAGEFDLSVGAIFGFAAIVATFVDNAAGLAPAVLAGLATGAGLGVINGLIVSRAGIQSFLATLATQFVFAGVAVWLTAGEDNWRVDDIEGFNSLADTTILSVQMKAWLGLAGIVVVGVLLKHTRFGRQVFAIGGNLAAARIAGVRIHLVRVGAFVVSGTLAALAGTLAASDTSVAQADGGIGMEFTAITAVIIGGTSIAGGRGSVWRTLTGVLLLAVIANGFTLLYIDPTYDLLLQGTIILGAVLADARLRGEARG
jgi:ribose/xylose/arabinose/galactoside ABC-type transport system permease subunit